jgi:hypothetical protein
MDTTRADTTPHVVLIQVQYEQIQLGDLAGTPHFSSEPRTAIHSPLTSSLAPPCSCPRALHVTLKYDRL